MSLRYSIQHKRTIADTPITYRWELDDRDFSGTTKEHIAGDTFFNWRYDKIDERNPFENPVQKSGITANLVVQTSDEETLLEDIINADEDRFTVSFFINNVLQWQGKVLMDSLRFPEHPKPFTVSIEARDLTVLKGKDFVIPETIVADRISEILAECLKKTGLTLPIRSFTNLTHLDTDETNDLLFELFHNRFAFQKGSQKVPMNCLEVVEAICRAYNLVLYQSGGRWIFDQIPALAKDDAVQFDYDSDGLNPISSTPNRDITVDNTDSFVVAGSDNIITGSLKSIQSVYKHKTLIFNVPVENTTHTDTNTTTAFAFDFQETGEFLFDSSVDVEVDVTNPESDMFGEAFFEVRANRAGDNSVFLASDGTWSETQTGIAIPISGDSNPVTGSFTMLPSDQIPGDEITSLQVIYKGAIVEVQVTGGTEQKTIEEIRWIDPVAIVFDRVRQDLDASITHEYRQSANFSVTEEIGETVLGDGPVEGDNRAGVGRPWNSGVTISVLEPGRFKLRGVSEQLDLQQITLREWMNTRRSSLRNLRIILFADFRREQIISYRNKRWYFLGGDFNAKQAQWNGNILQLAYNGDTTGDTFSVVETEGGDPTGTAATGTGSSSGGGLTESEADLIYLRQDNNLAELTDPITAQSNLKLKDATADLSLNTLELGGNWLLDSKAEDNVERLRLQAVGANDPAELFIQAKGSANAARITITPDSSSANFSALTMESNGTHHSIQSTIAGTESLLPIKMVMGTTDVFEAAVNGDLHIRQKLIADNGINLAGGDYQVSGTTVIDSLSNISGAQGTFTGLLTAQSAINLINSSPIQDAGNNAIEFDGAGNVTLPGNLEVLGSTVSANVNNIDVDDPLIKLADGNSTTAVDIGFIGQRSADNVGLIWDESQDLFATILTTDDATTAGNISITDYADFKANKLTISPSSSADILIDTDIGNWRNLNGGVWITPNNNTEMRIGPADGSDTFSMLINRITEFRTTADNNIFDGDVDVGKNLFVEGGAFFKELLVNTTKVFFDNFMTVGGGKISIIIDGTVGSEIIGFEDENGNRQVPVDLDDILHVQQRAGTSGVFVKNIWRKVSAINGNDITLTTTGITWSTTDDIGSLAVGDNVVTQGNTTDATRDHFIKFDISGSTIPTITGFNSVTDVNDAGVKEYLIGDLTQAPTLSNGADPTGIGLFTTNAFLEGTIVANSGKIGSFDISDRLSSVSSGGFGVFLDADSDFVWEDLENDAVHINNFTTSDLEVSRFGIKKSTNDYIYNWIKHDGTWGLMGMEGGFVKFRLGDQNFIGAINFDNKGLFTDETPGATSGIRSSSGTASDIIFFGGADLRTGLMSDGSKAPFFVQNDGNIQHPAIGGSFFTQVSIAPTGVNDTAADSLTGDIRGVSTSASGTSGSPSKRVTKYITTHRKRFSENKIFLNGFAQVNRTVTGSNTYEFINSIEIEIESESLIASFDVSNSVWTEFTLEIDISSIPDNTKFEIIINIVSDINFAGGIDDTATAENETLLREDISWEWST